MGEDQLFFFNLTKKVIKFCGLKKLKFMKENILIDQQ